MDSPPPDGTIVKSRTETVTTEDDGSVVTTTKTVYVTTVPSYIETEGAAGTLKKLSQQEEDLLVSDGNRRSVINRDAYLKLHSIDGGAHSSIGNLRERYETVPSENRLSDDTIQSLKEKYSPSNFGYPKAGNAPKLPPPVIPRTSSLRVKPDLPTKPEFLRYSYIPYARNKPEVAKRSSLLLARAPRIVQSERDPGLSDQEERVIVRRSSSEDSVGKIELELSEFTMDTKQKKRTSSFKRILTGGIFGKDKKKSEKKSDDKQKTKKTDNVIVSDNAQNEQNSVKRAALSQGELGDMEKRYAEMHINQFNRIKANFNQQQYNRTMQDKYFESSSSSNTLESEGTSSRQGTYQNALIAQAEMMHLRELELKALNETPLRANEATSKVSEIPSRANKASRVNEMTLRVIEAPKANETSLKTNETPPRAKETHQNVQLVKPKALIPISSERPLPNPYQNHENSDNNLNHHERDFDQSSYSPNVTKSSNSSNLNSPSSPGSYSTRSSPKSPTLEGSKLKLPQNREKISLQPRIKSPIPQNKVSTDKIIATELLKKADSKRSGVTHQNLEIEIDYPDRYDVVRSYKVVSSSPIGGENQLEAGKWHQTQRELEKSPSLIGLDVKQITADNQMSPNQMGSLKKGSNQMGSTQMGSNQLNSNQKGSIRMSPIQMTSEPINSNLITCNQNQHTGSVTPIRRAPSNASLQYSPTKQEMRQSVEIYCWKEIQKLKEKQDQELKYQLQYTPHGCVEDPIIHRRSRSVEPSLNRGRRSTSLPREAKPSQIERNNRYNQLVIPENRPVYYGSDRSDIYQNNILKSGLQHNSVHQSNYQQKSHHQNIPHQNIPHQNISHENIPQLNISQQNIHHQNNLQQNNLHQSNSHQKNPHQNVSHQSNLHQNVPHQSNPHQNVLHQNNLHQNVPHQNNLHQNVPHQSNPHQNVPHQNNSHQTVPHQNVSHQNIPQHQISLLQTTSPHHNTLYSPQIPHQNFLRSSPQRRTISSVERRAYDGYYTNAEVPYRPIFNRGSLNPTLEQYQVNQQKKNVSFNGKSQQNQGQWPTRNGYVESPPQRRLLDKSISMGSDDVFLSTNQGFPNQNETTLIRREPIYGSKPTEVNSRMPRRQIQEESYVIRRQIIEDPYGQRTGLYALQENKQNLNEATRQRQENISQNQIYSMQQMNHPVYSSKLSIQESPYGTRESVYGSRTDPLYGSQKQVTVSNKFCDIYGRIHDNDQQSTMQQSTIQQSTMPQSTMLRSPMSPPYGQQQGVIYGQLQGNNVTGRPPLHHSYNQLPSGFVRGSRLTSSANDMYRREQRILHGFNPNAPLPPIPMETKSQLLMRRAVEDERNFGK